MTEVHAPTQSTIKIYCECFEANRYKPNQCINCFHRREDHQKVKVKQRASVHAIRATLKAQSEKLREQGENVTEEQKRALRIQNIQTEILSTESSYLEQLNNLIQVNKRKTRNNNQ